MSAKANEKKITEALAFYKEGESLSKATLFRWKPDLEGAAIAYEKAAQMMQSAQGYESAKDAWQKASKAHYENGSTHAAAAAIENAAKCAGSLNEPAEASVLYETAANYYRENANIDKACAVLVKAAEIVSDTNSERSLELLMGTIEIFESEGKDIFAADCFKAAITLLLKQSKWKDALGVIKRQAASAKKADQLDRMHKANLGYVVVCLKMNDYVGADRAQSEFLQEKSYLRSGECEAANDLLQAFDEHDDERLAEVLKMQIFNFLDQQVIRTAKSLAKGATGGSSGGGGKKAAKAKAPQSDDDDDGYVDKAPPPAASKTSSDAASPGTTHTNANTTTTTAGVAADEEDGDPPQPAPTRGGKARQVESDDDSDR